MDLDRLRTGERIAGISGLVLLILLWLTWFNLDIPDAPGVEIDKGLSAWQAFSLIDIILFITAACAIALGLMAATQTSVNLPVTLSAIVAGLGILSVLLILIRIIATPDVGELGIEVDTTRSYGVFLGLLAALGITYGAWLTMQEEGTSFGGEADRARDRVGGGPGSGAPPPPPPPPAGGTGTGTGGGPAV